MKEYKKPELEKFNFPSEKALKESLKRVCNPRCNKCFGRGHTGFDTLKGFWRVCLCIDTNLLKQVGARLCQLEKTGEAKN